MSDFIVRAVALAVHAVAFSFTLAWVMMIGEGIASGQVNWNTSFIDTVSLSFVPSKLPTDIDSTVYTVVEVQP